ncbi:MAG: hypothetical protein GY771_12970 [bacterium]|nr:hypothetical protein [bacterium]
MDKANTKYEKMMYKRKYDYVRGKVEDDFKKIRPHSKEVEALNAELSDVTGMLSPQIKDAFSLDAPDYQPTVIFVYLD